MKDQARVVITCVTLFFWLGALTMVSAQSAIQDHAQSLTETDNELKFVVIISRHGVRSPTGKLDQLNRYSRQPWPTWTVPPGYLTEHGARLMTIFGAYDRELLTAQGLLAPTGCADAQHIRIIADSDQRTRETGKALAAGLAPGCAIEVSALPEGTNDPLFHPLGAGIASPNNLLAATAISGRIGGHPESVSEAYRPQLRELEEVLHGCNPAPNCPGSATQEPKSIFDIPSSIEPGIGSHPADVRSPLGTAATMAENILLEYAEGMDVGWGRVDIQKVRDLVQLHTANVDIAQRPAYIARIQSSNLLFHVIQSMEQAVSGHPVVGALTKPGDRLLILTGHDGNLASIAGALELSWLIDGRRDDTPPGGALVVEMWKRSGAEEYSVRTFYMAQTLDQMRNTSPLSLKNPPERVPVYVPGCSRQDGACGWAAFRKTVLAATDSTFVK